MWREMARGSGDEGEGRDEERDGEEGKEGEGESVIVCLHALTNGGDLSLLFLLSLSLSLSLLFLLSLSLSFSLVLSLSAVGRSAHLLVASCPT